MKIQRYNPKETNFSEKVFFIQSHGNNAGRPLKKPIPNSWKVETDKKNAFEICFVVFHSKILNLYIRGSVIPFISLREYRKIILPYMNNELKCDDTFKKLHIIKQIDNDLDNLEKRKTLYKNLKSALSIEILKKINAQL